VCKIPFFADALNGVRGGKCVSASSGDMDSHCTSAPRSRLLRVIKRNKKSGASVLLDRIADGDADVGCGRHGRKLRASFGIDFLRQLHVAHAAPQHMDWNALIPFIFMKNVQLFSKFSSKETS
jgi:hypothetical protein